MNSNYMHLNRPNSNKFSEWTAAPFIFGYICCCCIFPGGLPEQGYAQCTHKRIIYDWEDIASFVSKQI